ncbi:GH39 family glycosyl hydrolase [Actinophytocola sediminis]
MTETSARRNWARTSDDRLAGTAELPAPQTLTAHPGTGLVLLDWPAVEHALGYLVHRATDRDGPFEPLDHLGGDVLAVPHPPYADTLVEPGVQYHYRVATWSDDGPGPLSPAATAIPQPAGPQPAGVRVAVDAAATPRPLPDVWRRMIGAEHLSLLLWDKPGPGGSDVAAEYADALRIMRDDLGVRSVRAHGTFLPETVTVRADGTFDFTGLDAVYDRFLAIGLKPVVELSFMPRELCADPDYTVFAYDAQVSVPADWSRWADLVGALTTHLRDRYGADEVATWEFEVWNEANLAVFWNGTQDDYLRLYELAARAVKAVDHRIAVGGPSSAAAGWVGALLEHCRANDVPIDFVSTHTYGNAPLDLRPLTRSFAEATGRPAPRILWTEWGVTPTHFHRVNDTVFAAPFLLRGMKSALDTTDCLAYWVASDQFEELGWAPRLLHGGFGLLTVGNLRKPRFWALALLSALDGGRLPVSVTGDGAGGIVDALATRTESTVDVLVWNGTLDQSKIDGSAALDRTVTVEVSGLTPGTYELTARRVDERHGNLQRVWRELDGGDWPTGAQWRTLRRTDTLPVDYLGKVEVADAGTAAATVELPMPGIRSLRLTRRQ